MSDRSTNDTVGMRRLQTQWAKSPKKQSEGGRFC